MKDKDENELQSRATKADDAAKSLIECVENMESEELQVVNASFSILTDNGCYIVEVRKTL